LLGWHSRIVTTDATAQRGGGDLVFHWSLHRHRVAADLMAGPAMAFAERLDERVVVDGMAQEGTQVLPGVPGVHPAGKRPHVGDVRDPAAVRRRRIEAPFQQVGWPAPAGSPGSVVGGRFRPGLAPRIPSSRISRSKQKRSDLRLVGLGLVVTRDGGIPLAWHAYPGNKPDVTQFPP
jgi:hypothetical protein